MSSTTEQLKPCPFCGCRLALNGNELDLYVKRYGTYYDHPFNDCLLRGFEVSTSEREDWNRRTPTGATHDN